MTHPPEVTLGVPPPFPLPFPLYPSTLLPLPPPPLLTYVNIKFLIGTPGGRVRVILFRIFSRIPRPLSSPVSEHDLVEGHSDVVSCELSLGVRRREGEGEEVRRGEEWVPRVRGWDLGSNFLPSKKPVTTITLLSTPPLPSPLLPFSPLTPPAYLSIEDLVAFVDCLCRLPS